MTYTPWLDLAKNCKLGIGILEPSPIHTKAQQESAAALEAAGLADVVEVNGNDFIKWRVVQTPSGLEFAYATISDLDTANAANWAREFMRTIALGAELDEAFARSWFANAMERAAETARKDDREQVESVMKSWAGVDYGKVEERILSHYADPDGWAARIAAAREVVIDGVVVKSNVSSNANPVEMLTVLVRTLHDKHFDPHSHWKPSNDLVGLILQIDNMTAELVRPRNGTKPAELELLEHALRDWIGEMAFISRKTLQDGTPMMGKFEHEELYRRARAYLQFDPLDPTIRDDHVKALRNKLDTRRPELRGMPTDGEGRRDAAAAARKKGGAHFSVKDTSQLPHLEKALRMWMKTRNSSTRATLLEVAKRYFGELS